MACTIGMLICIGGILICISEILTCICGNMSCKRYSVVLDAATLCSNALCTEVGRRVYENKY